MSEKEKAVKTLVNWLKDLKKEGFIARAFVNLMLEDLSEDPKESWDQLLEKAHVLNHYLSNFNEERYFVDDFPDEE